MIMVLSCFDLVAVVANQPEVLVYAIYWLWDENDLYFEKKYYLHVAGVFHLFSPQVLFVMSIKRYLGAYYPIYFITHQ